MLDEHFLVTESDENGHFREANANFLRRTGYTLEELVSQPVDGLCSGNYSSEYISDMWSTVKSGKTWSGEFVDRAKNGSWFG